MNENEIRNRAHALITDLDALDLEVGLSLREYYAPWGLLNSVLHDKGREGKDHERWLRLAEGMIGQTKREHQR